MIHLLFANSAQAEEIANAPKIVFDTEKLDLGQIIPGDKAVGVFTVRNEGGDTLIIKRVAPT